jgi:hypothetical protein
LLAYEPGGNLLASELQIFGVETPENVKKRSDQTGSPRLVAGAEPRAVFTVEVFIEESHVPPAKPEAWFVNRSKRFGRLRRHACYSNIFS